MAYVPTGYSRGRPRIGEIRPPSPLAKQIEYTRRRRKSDPEFRARLNASFTDWRRANPERYSELQKSARLRKKGRVAAGWTGVIHAVAVGV